ncbi:putative adenylate/guanylate cyclase [Mycobacterium xenopi 3993]|nr:putative adenylate/guanylate cyclase [Mycobacterium xenopi 3993]
MAGSWSLHRLATVAAETEERVCSYADLGLLYRHADADFEPDSLQPLRLIQFAQARGVGAQQLAAATSHGDLLDIFQELAPPSGAPVNLTDIAAELGLDDEVVTDLIEILQWNEIGAITDTDVSVLRVVARALASGLPRDTLMQLVRVFADAMERLADAEVRTFHNYVHERLRAQGLVGRELLGASTGIAKPLFDLIKPAVVYFHRRAYQQANREHLLRHIAEETTHPPWHRARNKRPFCLSISQVSPRSPRQWVTTLPLKCCTGSASRYVARQLGTEAASSSRSATHSC